MTNIWTDLVYSPDENGWYFRELHRTKLISRVSKLYDTENEALTADDLNKIEWEEWS